MNLDDIKVILASVTGLGNWMVSIDLALKVGISLASLIYIVLKIRELLRNGSKSKDSRLVRAGVSGYNKPKRTPSHPKKSHVVVAKQGDQVKTIRFGQQGVKTNQTVGQRKAFKSRHAKNISRGKLSAAYWADRVKWSPSKTASKSTKWKKG